MGSEFVTPVYGAFAKVWTSTIALLPHVIAAIIILLVGFIVGKAIGKIVKEILIRSRIDNYVKIKKAELKISHVFTVILKWIVYLVFIQQAAEALSVGVISMFVSKIVSFLPGVIEAILVVSVGYAIARYVQNIIKESEAIYAGIMSKVFFFFIVYISIAIALPLVGLDPWLVNNIMLIIVGSAGLGFAIAIGLGMKHAIREITDEFEKVFEKQLKKQLKIKTK